MSVLVLGLSHRTASLDVLEQVALETSRAAKLRQAVLDSAHVTEAVVMSTCNRVEIYAAVERFHASIEDITAAFSDVTGLDSDVWLPSVYVLYDEGAVAHLFAVATGLDSMVIGEAQVIGQVKDALRSGQEAESVGPVLNGLFQQALRVGKRAHSETGIDQTGRSLVSVALDDVERLSGALAGRRVTIIGAGSMSALTAATLRRRGVGDLTILNRSPEHASALGAEVGGRHRGLDVLGEQLRVSDLVVSCTGAVGVRITEADVRAAMAGRTSGLVIVDLALPHDVDPAVAGIDGVSVVGLSEIADQAKDVPADDAIEAVRRIVREELTAFRIATEQASVAPTVVALRSMATALVGSELERLWNRLGDLSDHDRAEIALTVRRVADKLLHEPTVRVKELRGKVPSTSYAAALAELFALDPGSIKAVTEPGDER
jgi:glutamyl-tRNA reductase